MLFRSTQTLPRIVGNSAALHAVLTGHRYPAADAHRRGFVDEVVPVADLHDRALEVAADLAAMIRDEGMRTRADALGKRIASEDGVARACEAIEAALDRARIRGGG